MSNSVNTKSGKKPYLLLDGTIPSVFPDNLPKSDNLTSYVSWKDVNCRDEQGVLQREVIVLDADGVVLGRLASFVAHVLRSKNRADYTPHIRHSPMVVIINAEKVVLTGRKEVTKMYYHHTGYPGGIKERSVKSIRSGKNPTFLLEHAIKGMIGRYKLGDSLLSKNLRIYTGSSHPHLAQKPQVIDFTSKSKKNSIK